MYWLTVTLVCILYVKGGILGQSDEICSNDLNKLRSEQWQNNVFIGCQVLNVQYNNETVGKILDSFYCPSNQETNSTFITVN
jgi:hypothetical protein